jgi:hypothetical protein
VTDKREVQETILVVEADILVRMPIAQYLRDYGYRVIETSIRDPKAMRAAGYHVRKVNGRWQAWIEK